MLMLIFISPFRSGKTMDRENYFFDIEENPNNDKVFVLIIYDIINNKTRTKLSKLLLGYGFRIQKSAFEAVITKRKYKELLERLPAFAGEEDSIRIYKIVGKGQVITFGKEAEETVEDVVVI